MNTAKIASRIRSRPVGFFLLLLGMVAISACQADFDVMVTVEEDGSGIVETITTLDREASEALLDLDLEAAGLPLADLAQSGWNVSRPERSADGSTVVTASKEFGTTSQFSEVMAELTGDDGVLRNFRLTRTKTFAQVDYEIEGTIDTTEGLEGFGDDALRRALGQSLVEIAEGYGAGEEDVRLSVDLALPGEIQGEPPPEALDTNGTTPQAVWNVQLERPEVTSVRLASATREVSALVLRGIAVVAGVLACLVVFAQLLRILLPDRRRRSNRRRPPRNRPPEPKAPETVAAADAGNEDPSSTAEAGEARPRVVALDGLGVLYGRGDGMSRALIPFARERASRVTDDEIEAKSRLLELGRITTGEFWSSIGVDGDPGQIDADYLAQLQLTPGVVKYLRSLRDKEVRIACIANEPTEWASRLRVSHSLDGLIDPWVISGAVGVRKPDRSIFEVLRRTTGEQPGSILVVDDDLDVLDGARELGFATAWFSADATKELARDHGIIRNFDVLADQETEAEPSA